jgi:hypothetical protein
MRRWVSECPKGNVWVYLIIRVVASCSDDAQRRDQGRLVNHLDIPGLFLDHV